jgi:hypothetical protein
MATYSNISVSVEIYGHFILRALPRGRKSARFSATIRNLNANGQNKKAAIC